MNTKPYAVLESVPDALLMVDRQGLIRFANQHAERLFGYAPDKLIGAKIEALIPERYQQQHVESRVEFSANPTTRPMGVGRELLALKSDGEEFPVEIGLGPGMEEGCVIAVVRDISAVMQTQPTSVRSPGKNQP